MNFDFDVAAPTAAAAAAAENSRRRNQNPTNPHELLLAKHMSLMLNGVCRLGLIPVYWDQKAGHAKLISSRGRVHVCKWIAMLLALSAGCAGLLADIAVRTVKHGFISSMTDMSFMYHFLLSLTSSLSLFFLYHTALKRHQLVALLNEVTHFWIGFSAATDTDAEREATGAAERMFCRIINFCHYGLITASWFALPSYMIKCDQHLLAPILPVCLNYGAEPYEWFVSDLLSFVYFLLMNGVMCVWLALHTSSVAVMVSVISANTLFSQAALAHLTSKTSNTSNGHDQARVDVEAAEGRQRGSKMARDEALYCVGVYRSLQILAQDQDLCFAHDMWPALIAIFSTVSLTSVPLSVHMTDPIQKAGTPATFFVFTTMLWGFLDFGSRLHGAARHFARESRLRSARARSPYLRRLFDSCEKCASFRVRIGSFGYLSKSTVGVVLGVLFENIGALLIMTKE